MNRSESINELAAAMAKAQGSIENAAKDAANPFFRSKYADLASCWDACRKALSDNGLAVIQLPRTEGATVTITTILTHSSGQFISEDLTMTSKRQLKDGGGWEIVDNPQGLGSTITYARRYSLCAMVGVAPEDDDGNAGSGRGSQQAADQVAQRKISENRQVATDKAAMLRAYQEIRAIIGDLAYSNILGGHKMQNAEQITDMTLGRSIYAEMVSYSKTMPQPHDVGYVPRPTVEEEK